MAEKRILGIGNKERKVMKYNKPNFEHEWNEATRYRELEKMGKEKWIKFASKNFDITNYEKIKDVLGNVNLNFKELDLNKKKRFQKAFNDGEIEIPIVIKFSEKDYDLLGGNTRLSGLVSKGINPKLWVVDLSKVKDITEKWSEKYKKSIDCNNPKGFSQKAHCQGRKKKIDEIEKIKGGLSHKMSLGDIAEKHKVKIDDLTKEFLQGVKIEMEHTNSKNIASEIAMDHLVEDPKYYSKLKKIETKESVGADSSGSFESSQFLSTKTPIVKRKINKIPNFTNQLKKGLNEEGILGTGEFDVPLFGKTTKGRKNPLKIDGPDSIYKNRAVKDKKWPRYGGPKGIYVKVKEKCKKFPYCNQGDTGALEFIREDKELQTAIFEVSKKYGIPYKEMEKIVLNQIKEIFI